MAEQLSVRWHIEHHGKEVSAFSSDQVIAGLDGAVDFYKKESVAVVKGIRNQVLLTGGRSLFHVAVGTAAADGVVLVSGRE